MAGDADGRSNIIQAARISMSLADCYKKQQINQPDWGVGILGRKIHSVFLYF